MKKETLIPIAFWIAVFCTLFIIIQSTFRYHFYFIEQNQLFLFSWPYISERLVMPGGFALIAGEFLVQFFTTPYMAAIIIAALLTSVGTATAGIVRIIDKESSLRLLSLLVVISLFFIHCDFNYLTQGTIAYLLTLGAIALYLKEKRFSSRLSIGIALTVLLFWLGGSVALLFGTSILFIEFASCPKKGIITILLPAIALILGTVAVYSGLLGEFRFAFLPDMFYQPQLQAHADIYFAWILLPLILFLVTILKKRKQLQGIKRYVCYVCLLALAVFFVYKDNSKYCDYKSYKLKELDYYARNNQWNELAQACKGKLTNYLYMSYLNMALAKEGKLAEHMFDFDQHGLLGLIVNSNKSQQISSLLSEIYFTMSNFGSAQEMAFEANISTLGYSSPRMLMRLVQTNLIFGSYPVAEKYISLLEKTYSYKKWANEQRKFLYNDKAIAADPFYSNARRSLPINHLEHSEGLAGDLQAILNVNPNDKNAFDYLSAIYLLSKDMNDFKPLLERFYGSKVLPKLPDSFQEAIIIYSEGDSNYWSKYNVSPTVIARYNSFKQIILQNRGNYNIQSILQPSYGNTYWYYFMFK